MRWCLAPQHVNNTCTRCSDSSVHQYCILPHSVPLVPEYLNTQVYTLRCLNNALVAIQTSSMAKFCTCTSFTMSPASMAESYTALGAPGLGAGSSRCSGPGSADDACPGADPTCTGGHPHFQTMLKTKLNVLTLRKEPLPTVIFHEPEAIELCSTTPLMKNRTHPGCKVLKLLNYQVSSPKISVRLVT
ncbi:PCLI1 protein, partial [Polyodon spathula]|nr:PCLI1 protein [Polyodon spathula]